MNLIAFFMPDTVVVGGGVGARCFGLMATTINYILEQHRSLVPTAVNLRVAETGDDAGMLGAGLGALRSNAAPSRSVTADEPAIGYP